MDFLDLFYSKLRRYNRFEQGRIKKYDAISLCRLYAPWKIEYGKIKLYWMYFRKVISLILGYSLNVVSYNKAINLIDSSFYENEKSILILFPHGIILHVEGLSLIFIRNQHLLYLKNM